MRSVAIACLLGLSLPAHAKSVTMNDVTIELPDTFKVSDSTRGLKAQSSDNEVDLWVETYKDATWKGKPTVLRYLNVGPLGSENKHVLFTLRASPSGDSAHSKEVDAIVDSVEVSYAK